jgi:hypothetical protein
MAAPRLSGFERSHIDDEAVADFLAHHAVDGSVDLLGPPELDIRFYAARPRNNQ